jgi:hypothetical protein
VPLDVKSPSFFSSERWFGKIALFQYEVRAQFIPMDAANNIEVTKEHVCSNYTGCREITIRNATPVVNPSEMEPKEYNHERKMTTGFLGMGKKQTATFTVESPKQIYALGEQVHLKVTSDNTGCDKPMEQILVRLIFRSSITAKETGWGGWKKTKEIGPLKVFKCLG